jgi:hypothetical protein
MKKKAPKTCAGDAIKGEAGRINDALVKAGGDEDYAAILLSMSTRELRDRMAAHPELRPWVEGRPPNDSEALKAAKLPPAQSKMAQVVEALSEESAELRMSLAKTGVSDGHITHVLALRDLAQKNFESALETAHGGMIRTLVECNIERAKLGEQLAELLDGLGDLKTNARGSKERGLILSELIAVNSVRDSCAIEMEKVVRLMQSGMIYWLKMHGPKKLKKKPGFEDAK